MSTKNTPSQDFNVFFVPFTGTEPDQSSMLGRMMDTSENDTDDSNNKNRAFFASKLQRSKRARLQALLQDTIVRDPVRGVLDNDEHIEFVAAGERPTAAFFNSSRRHLAVGSGTSQLLVIPVNVQVLEDLLIQQYKDKACLKRSKRILLFILH